jgi:hypothetical protein
MCKFFSAAETQNYCNCMYSTPETTGKCIRFENKKIRLKREKQMEYSLKRIKIL